METNTGRRIVQYIIEIPATRKDDLGSIRHWDNIKMASHADSIWIKDITPRQIDTPEIRKLPQKNIYTIEQQLLFKLNGLVPTKKLPHGLLWTPIERALPIKLPDHTNNYYQPEKRKIKLKTVDKEHEPDALLIEMNELERYIKTAPAIRLNKIKWIIVEGKALLIGKPLLPINGISFWFKSPFFLPCGMDFEYSILQSYFMQLLDPLNENFVIWLSNQSIIRFSKYAVKPLNIGSFRLTQAQNERIK